MDRIDFSVLLWAGMALAFLPSFGLGLLVGWWLL